MHHDAPLWELRPRALHQLEKMLLVGVDALVLEKAEEVELGVVRLPLRNEALPLRALEELAGGESVVDALELLHHDAARAHVEVAHLGAALVAVGQAHGLAAAVEQAVRVARPYLVDHRRLGSEHGIPLASRVHSPSIADYQNYWSHFILSLLRFWDLWLSYKYITNHAENEYPPIIF